MDLQHALRNAANLYHMGQYGQVEAACRVILKARPGQPDALHLLGVVTLQGGKHEKAIGLIKKALRKNPGNASYYVTLGEAYRGYGRPAQAIPLFQQALKIDPRKPEAHCGLGNALLAQGKIDDALASYDQAIEIGPGLAQAHYNRGNALAGKGETDSAIAAYRKAIEIDPGFRDARFNLANMLAGRGDLRAAATEYEECLSLDQDFARGWYGVGEVLRKLGHRDSARKAYEQAATLDPMMTDAHLQLGTIAKLQARFDDAMESLNRVTKDAKIAALAHAEIGHVLYLQRRFLESMAAYRRSVDCDPNYAWGYMGLSSALAEMGDETEACEVSRKAVRLRRSFDWPFRGQEAVGKIVTLKGVESGHFLHGPNDSLMLTGGMNSADNHFDDTRFRQASFYVDDLQPGAELEALPPCDVIYNAVSDVDAMPRSLEIASRLAAATSIPIINQPDLVAKTTRQENYERFRSLDGVLFPKTLYIEGTVESKARLTATLEDAELPLPIIIRRVGTHVGESLEKKDSLDALWDYIAEDPTGPFYVTEFVDYKTATGHYIKTRVQFVDGVPYPNHLWYSDDWCIVRGERSRALMDNHPWMEDEAKRFMSDFEDYFGEHGFKALREIHGRLPLDYFGIDCSLLKDGRILLFEINAAMYLKHTHEEQQEFRKPYLQAINEALNDLMEKKILEGRIAGAT